MSKSFTVLVADLVNRKAGKNGLADGVRISHIQAKQRVDLWHVSERIWAVANDLHGNEHPEARQWAQQRIAWLKRREDGALDVIGDLRQIRENSDMRPARPS